MPGPIITRKEWGAEHPDGDGHTTTQPAKEVWLHHSVTQAPPESASFEQDRNAVKLMEQIGQARFGAGISYTFVIPRSGRIFQGHSVTKRGTHTGGRNSTSRAICLIGNYEVLSPTNHQVDAIRWLLWRGQIAGWWRVPQLNGGHRDVKQTACPGIHAYERIADMNLPWEGAPPVTPPQLGDPVQTIDLKFYNDDWAPDPAGLNFRASCPAEAGDNSAVVAHAWVRWAFHWGTATMRVVAWDALKPIGEADPKKDFWKLPAGVRSFTVEGRRLDPKTTIGVSLIVQPKA
jgi:hypothetical protein